MYGGVAFHARYSKSQIYILETNERGVNYYGSSSKTAERSWIIDPSKVAVILVENIPDPETLTCWADRLDSFASEPY